MFSIWGVLTPYSNFHGTALVLGVRSVRLRQVTPLRSEVAGPARHGGARSCTRPPAPAPARTPHGMAL